MAASLVSTTSPILESLYVLTPQCGFLRQAHTRWEPPSAKSIHRSLVCVHGVTRNGRDFDWLAQRISREDGYSVYCPDVIGRGRSDWLHGCPEDYNTSVYSNQLAVLLAHAAAAQQGSPSKIDYLGTSMGGICGMILASKENSPIRRLILNDIGAYVNRSELQRISAYLCTPPEFDSLGELERYLHQIYEQFGDCPDEYWKHITQQSARIQEDGKIRMHYDPNIGRLFQQGSTSDIDLWQFWDAIKCPVLILRGADSKILTRETATEMKARGPDVTVVEFPGTGHAPPLMVADQIDAVRDWLYRTNAS